MENKGPKCAWLDDLNLHIIYMFEGIFWLDAAQPVCPFTLIMAFVLHLPIRRISDEYFYFSMKTYIVGIGK